MCVSSNNKRSNEKKPLTHVSRHDTLSGVIGNFKSKNLRQFWETGQPRGINPKLAKKVEFLLDALYDATDIEHLNLPGTGLHQLVGQRQGQWSMVVSRNWRITFRFENGKAFNVDFEDYHGK